MTVIINGTDNSASTPAVTGTDGDTGMFYPAANTVALSTGGSERMRVDSSGNVGIGTTSPVVKLQIAGDAVNTIGASYGTNIYFDSGASTNKYIANGFGGVLTVAESGSGGFRFYTAPSNSGGAGANATITERARITSGGDFQFNSGYGSVATAYGCRAWVNFNGTTNVGGNCTIRASGNVSTVADNGTGKYTVNFTNAFPDASYTVAGSGAIGDASDDANILICAPARDLVTYSTTACAIRYVFPGINANANFTDPLIGTAIFHR
jgi:hypothetical protein